MTGHQRMVSKQHRKLSLCSGFRPPLTRRFKLGRFFEVTSFYYTVYVMSIEKVATPRSLIRQKGDRKSQPEVYSASANAKRRNYREPDK
jgi:hypothetical protein